MLAVPSIGNRQYSFDPSRTALIIVDMQFDFVDSNGACAAAGADVAPLQLVIPRIQRVLEQTRKAGISVVHTRYGFRPDLSDLPQSVREQSRDAGGEYGTPGPMGRILTRGEPGHAIVPQLMPLPTELIVDKATFGAFTNTGLDAYLKERKISHVVVCGVTSQCCVEGTIREAVDRGYYVLTLEDCCGAFEPELQAGFLRAMQSEGHLFGWIANSNDFAKALHR